MDEQIIISLCARAIASGIEASAAILEIYNTPFEHELKADGSPLTAADNKSNQIISDALGNTGIPIISEESSTVNYETRKNWDYFWLLDPLDGTKDFINRNDEFAINIALVKDSKPILGIIISPVMQKVWWGLIGFGNFVLHWQNNIGDLDPQKLMALSKPIEVNYQTVEPSALVSRFHLDEETESFFETLKERLPGFAVKTRGSSLKYCDLIEGKASIHLRFSGGTSEWDTAAGQAMLVAAGGNILNIETREPLKYNKENLKNPGFVAFACKEVVDSIMGSTTQGI
jgi:3'(2'), 5'-bisphosphate nucleotidase